jgi:hypothetical protein
VNITDSDRLNFLEKYPGWMSRSLSTYLVLATMKLEKGNDKRKATIRDAIDYALTCGEYEFPTRSRGQEIREYFQQEELPAASGEVFPRFSSKEE